jgi:hypothetical protein
MILIAALAINAAAEAATLTPLLTEKGMMVALKGDIVREDANTLENLIRSNAAQGHVIHGLQLDSAGGNLLGGIRLARLIRGHGDLSTSIIYGATCASACFLVFAAGREKFVNSASLVGVHGVADKSGNVTEETEAATRAMAYFCKELGVPAQITDRLIATPPGDIVWLSPDDLRSMGAILLGSAGHAASGIPQEAIAKIQAP